MRIVLLDTNIVSFLLKGDTRAANYEPFIKQRQLAISFMTVAELYQWAAVRNWGANRRQQLTQTLQENYIVLSFDVQLCQLWGELRAMCEKAGRPISPQDAWIAATALQYNLPLVTHNSKDFSSIADLEIMTILE